MTNQKQTITRRVLVCGAEGAFIDAPVTALAYGYLFPIPGLGPTAIAVISGVSGTTYALSCSLGVLSDVYTEDNTASYIAARAAGNIVKYVAVALTVSKFVTQPLILGTKAVLGAINGALYGAASKLAPGHNALAVPTEATDGALGALATGASITAGAVDGSKIGLSLIMASSLYDGVAGYFGEQPVLASDQQHLLGNVCLANSTIKTSAQLTLL